MLKDKCNNQMAVRFSLALLLVFILAPVQAISWGPITHLHLAERALGLHHPDIWYGAGLPDLNQFVLDNPQAAQAVRYLTHYEFERLPASMFAHGFTTHNEIWGTDWYSHQYFLSRPSVFSRIYSTRKIVHLSNVLGVKLGEAEFLFEFAIEYLLYLEEGGETGRKLLLGALLFTRDKEEMLVEAFAAPLQELLPEMTLEEAALGIQAAARLYRTATETYGAVFMQHENAVRALLRNMTAVYLGLAPSVAESHLDYAIALCQDDYRAELDRIIRLLRSDMLVHLSNELHGVALGCFHRQSNAQRSSASSMILPTAVVLLACLGYPIRRIAK